MGLFNKIVNYMTGGSAEVDVDITDAHIGSPFPAKVTATIKDNDLNAESVYLLIRCQEAYLEGYTEGETETDNERILRELNEWVFKTLYENRIEVEGAKILEAGQTYEWDVNINLEGAEKRSFESKGKKVIWEVQAGVDVPGNDPDSGWVAFQVN